MKATTTVPLAVLALLPALGLSFVVLPPVSTAVLTRPSSSSSAGMAKGFGTSDGEESPSSSSKAKSEGQRERERASGEYDKIAAAGGQEYAIFVRQFGSADDSWLPCGSIAVRRGEQVSNAIFGNEEALKAAIARSFPKLRGFEQEFEYGFNLKIYPDEPVTVAVKQSQSTGPSLGNWISNLLSPIDASNVPPPSASS